MLLSSAGPFGLIAVSAAIFSEDLFFADQWHHGAGPIALSGSCYNMSLAPEWLPRARRFSPVYQNVPSLTPCLQQGMCYRVTSCGRRRYYWCRPSIDGQNVDTGNHKTTRISLDCVLFYVLKMCGYSITIMSLADACVICSIRQLLPCIVCRILFAGCSLYSRTRSLNARQHIRKKMEGPSLPTAFSNIRFAVGSESCIQDSHSGSTGSHSNDAKVSILESSENTDNFRQAGPSLVILNHTQSSEGLAVDKRVGISTS